MTTAIIGTGGIGSVIARQLASGGKTPRLVYISSIMLTGCVRATLSSLPAAARD